MSGYAIQTRLDRLKSQESGKIFLLAFDATLHSGPTHALRDPNALISQVTSGLSQPVQGVLAHFGFFRSAMPPELRTSRVISATASTVFDDPRDKGILASANEVVAEGADVISGHLSLRHPRSRQMLTSASRLVQEGHALGFPVMLASYVTGSDPVQDSDAVLHAATVARDLGADIIKIPYTGTAANFQEIVNIVKPALVLAAGGPNNGPMEAKATAAGALEAGAAGICFGRSIFETDNPLRMVSELAIIVHKGAS